MFISLSLSLAHSLALSLSSCIIFYANFITFVTITSRPGTDRNPLALELSLQTAGQLRDTDTHAHTQPHTQSCEPLSLPLPDTDTIAKLLEIFSIYGGGGNWFAEGSLALSHASHTLECNRIFVCQSNRPGPRVEFCIYFSRIHPHLLHFIQYRTQ